MKDTKISETFKAKKAAPDISLYTDDLLGPSLSIATPKIPDSIKMLNGKRKIAPLIEPKIKSTPKKTLNLKPKFGKPKETEEENEEGELLSHNSSKSPLIKSNNVEPEIPRLSNKEQATQLGLNHDAKQKVKAFDKDKTVSPSNIPQIVTKGVSEISHIIPHYHTINKLPDNIRVPLQAINKPLFKTLTSISINDIQILANVNNQGPNSFEEIRAVKRWVLLRGRANENLSKSIPVQFHDFVIYDTDGITHLMLVGGNEQFIFSWPSVKNHITK